MPNSTSSAHNSLARPIRVGFWSRHRYWRDLVIVVASLAASFVAVNGILYTAQLGRVPLLTKINGVNVGLKTIAVAEAELSRQHALRQMQIKIVDDVYNLSVADVGVNIDTSKSLQQAMEQHGWQRLPIVKLIANTTVNFGAQYSVNNSVAEDAIKPYLSKYNQPAVDAKLVMPTSAEQEPSIVPEQQGYSLVASDVAQNVVTAAVANNLEVKIEPKVELAKVTAEDLKPKLAQAKAVLKTTSLELYSIVENFAKTHSGTYKVGVLELGGESRSAYYGGDDITGMASVYKMFTSYVALKKVEDGSMSMSSPTGSGTVDYCIRRMIIVSDNSCGVSLSGKIGWAEVDKVDKAAGFTRTTLNSSSGTYGTARDQVNLLTKLYSGDILSGEHRDYLFSLMKQQVYRSGIPAGSSGSVVANKVGFLGGYNNDMGIVYSPKATYAVSIMTSGSSFANIKLLASQIYDFYN